MDSWMIRLDCYRCQQLVGSLRQKRMPYAPVGQVQMPGDVCPFERQPFPLVYLIEIAAMHLDIMDGDPQFALLAKRDNEFVANAGDAAKQDLAVPQHQYTFPNSLLEFRRKCRLENGSETKGEREAAN